MQESTVSAPSAFVLPLWGRIAFACFMFAVSALLMWDKFFHFDWVGFLCFGLYYLLYVPIQKGEARRTYFSKPRTIISSVFLIGILALALRTLYDAFTNYRY